MTAHPLKLAIGLLERLCERAAKHGDQLLMVDLMFVLALLRKHLREPA